MLVSGRVTPPIPDVTVVFLMWKKYHITPYPCRHRKNQPLFGPIFRIFFVVQFLFRENSSSKRLDVFLIERLTNPRHPVIPPEVNGV